MSAAMNIKKGLKGTKTKEWLMDYVFNVVEN
jgi:hypothetical protein